MFLKSSEAEIVPEKLSDAENSAWSVLLLSLNRWLMIFNNFLDMLLQEWATISETDIGT